jgi:hypothetical protein
MQCKVARSSILTFEITENLLDQFLPCGQSLPTVKDPLN